MPYPIHLTDMRPIVGPPPIAVRIISGFVWEHFIEPELHRSRTSGGPLPRMGTPGTTRIYITDPQSVAVCTRAEDFAFRMSFPSTPSPMFSPTPRPLPIDADPLRLIRSYGCVLVFFVPPAVRIESPPPTSVNGRNPSSPGLTLGGAREWVMYANPEINLLSMEAFFISPSGTRWGPIQQ